jgi:hypothetical protein
MQPGAAELVDKQQVVLEQVVGIVELEKVVEAPVRLSAQGVVVAWQAVAVQGLFHILGRYFQQLEFYNKDNKAFSSPSSTNTTYNK